MNSALKQSKTTVVSPQRLRQSNTAVVQQGRSKVTSSAIPVYKRETKGRKTFVKKEQKFIDSNPASGSLTQIELASSSVHDSLYTNTQRSLRESLQEGKDSLQAGGNVDLLPAVDNSPSEG